MNEHHPYNPDKEGHSFMLNYIGSIPERIKRKEPFTCLLVGTLALGLTYGVAKTTIETIDNAKQREQSRYELSEYQPCKDGSIQPPDQGCAEHGGNSTFGQ